METLEPLDNHHTAQALGRPPLSENRNVAMRSERIAAGKSTSNRKLSEWDDIIVVLGLGLVFLILLVVSDVVDKLFLVAR